MKPALKFIRSEAHMVRRLFGNPPWYPDEEDDAVSWYDVMQVCINGHKITEVLRSSPEFGKQHCSKCGAATISQCPTCQTEIQGDYHVPNVVAIGFSTSVPAFCHKCGEPYPWTSQRLKAAQELAEELEDLSEEERQTLKASLVDLVRDTPRTTLAAIRFKRIAAKAGMGAAEAFKDILVGVISETAKKLIWP